MESLHFGARARRRARLGRWKVPLAVVTLALSTVVPSISGVALVSSLFEEESAFALQVGSAAAVADGPRTFDAAENITKLRAGLIEVRPEPKPEPEPEPEPAAEPAAASAAAPAGSIESIIYAAAAEFGISGDYLLSVAMCESTLNPNAYSPAGYHGLFQYDQTTWAAYGYGSIYDPTAQARTTAMLLSQGHQSRWPNCA